MTTHDDITAIIVAYNSTTALPGCLAALRDNGVAKIVIVDNGSSDNVAAWLDMHAPHVKLVRHTQNQGFGRAMNAGVAAATTEWCLLINPDARLEVGAVDTLLPVARAYPDAALFGPAIFEKGETTPIFSARAPLSYFLPNPSGTCTVPTGPASTPFISGACMLVRRADFLQLGGFDPNIFLYYEDDDLCRRFSEARLGPVYVPSARVHHAGGKSSTPRPGLAHLVKWHQTWSRLYVARKYGLRHAAPRRILPLLLRHSINWLKTNLKNATPTEKERAAAAVSGTWAFLRGQTALKRQKLI